MNLDAIKERLNKLNQENGNGGADFKKFFWTAPLGKSTIRIVPSMYNPDDVATELQFHTKLSKYPILALTNFHKQDPVEEFRAKLRDIGGKDNWSLNGKLTPVSNYYVPIIVRGEEDKGVRLWRVGITMYKALMQMAADEEIGDFTDVSNGCDIKVNKAAGNPYPETTVSAARENSPLSSDPALVEKWLKEQPEPIKCFREPTYEYVKKQLETWLNGGVPAKDDQSAKGSDSESSEKVSAGVKEESAKTIVEQPAKRPVAEKPAVKSVTQKFDDLFGSSESGSDKDPDDIDDIFNN